MHAVRYLTVSVLRMRHVVYGAGFVVVDWYRLDHLNRAIWGSEAKPLLPLTAERFSGSKIGLLTRAPILVPGHDQIADFVGWMSLML